MVNPNWDCTQTHQLFLPDFPKTLSSDTWIHHYYGSQQGRGEEGSLACISLAVAVIVLVSHLRVKLWGRQRVKGQLEMNPCKIFAVTSWSAKNTPWRSYISRGGKNSSSQPSKTPSKKVKPIFKSVYYFYLCI